MIAPLLADGHCAAEKRRHRQEIMDGYKISERTLRKYVERYRKNGLKGLEPKPKMVAGTFLAIPAEILELAKQYKAELPERSVRSVTRQVIYALQRQNKYNAQRKQIHHVSDLCGLGDLAHYGT